MIMMQNLVQQRRLVVLILALTVILLYTYLSVNPNTEAPKAITQYGRGFKRILLWTGFFGVRNWGFKLGQEQFILNKCKESRCFFTFNRDRLVNSDALLFHTRDLPRGLADLPSLRYSYQRWIFFTAESPPHTYSTQVSHDPDLSMYNNLFNWTMTYKKDSDIQFKDGIFRLLDVPRKDLPYAAITKSKLALWYVSNCAPSLTGKRTEYVNQLKSMINLDIYGTCGDHDPCEGDRSGPCVLDLKKKYKFYLAFENSRCHEYITEKMWTALHTGMVPIVRGANIDEYKQVAPPDSFIHVDNFTSPKDLAKYIKYLDKTDEAYNKYQLWRQRFYLVEKSNGQMICDLCERLHDNRLTPKVYSDLSTFWGVQENCWET